MERALCVIIGYAFGLFQTGYIYGRLNHIDIREYGSGNAGTTNALRVLGKKAGIITYLGDCFKAVLAGMLVWFLFRENYPEPIKLLLMYSGFGVVLGHNYPFYLKFKGGKGIAATSGMILAFDWRMAICAAVIFLSVTLITRYVSLASLCMMTGFLIAIVALGQIGGLGVGKPWLYEIYILVFLMTALAFYKHKANIVRLFNGTESKLGEKKKENK